MAQFSDNKPDALSRDVPPELRIAPDNANAATSPQPVQAEAHDGAKIRGIPDPEEVLVPKLDERFALSRSQFFVLIGVCLFFMYYNYMRLFHSDFWGHVAYGTWILEYERLPEQDMFVAQAEGMPIVATAWGAQVILGLIGRLGDDELFSHLFAVTILVSFVILGLTFRMQAGTSRPAMLGCLGVLLIWLSRHAVIRPEIFALLCFSATLFLTALSDSQRTRNRDDQATALSSRKFTAHLLAVFFLYVFWANLHGSFLVGFAVLGAYALGRAIEVSWKEGDILAAFSDRIVQQRLITFWVAFAATLVNPYALDLHIYTLQFPLNPNLADVEEWYSLDMTFMEGPSMAFSWILTCVLFRHSRRRILPADVILLLLFSAAVCARVRMTQWYAPVAVFVLAPHIGDCYRQLVRHLEHGDFGNMIAWMRYRSFRMSLIGLFAIWFTFCFSPVSRLVLGGSSRSAEHVYSADTPRGVTDYFRRNPPRGQIMNPQWWGDWLVWDGPKDLRVFMTTNALHAVPSTVWRDYMAMARADSGYESLLNKYRINTIVICKALQQKLRREAPQMPGWTTVFEDDTAIVIARKGTLPPDGDDKKSSKEPGEQLSTEKMAVDPQES